MSVQTDLRPCPCCGGKAVLWSESSRRTIEGEGPLLKVMCEGCGLQTVSIYGGNTVGPNPDTLRRIRLTVEQHVVDLWNRRT